MWICERGMGIWKEGRRGLLVFFRADKAGLVHEMRDGVGFVRVLGYFVYDPHGGKQSHESFCFVDEKICHA